MLIVAITEIMEARDLTIEEVSKESGIPVKEIELLRTDCMKSELTIEDIVSIARVLRCNVKDMLIELEDNEKE